jgi:hypothetical protein
MQIHQIAGFKLLRHNRLFQHKNKQGLQIQERKVFSLIIYQWADVLVYLVVESRNAFSALALS